MQVSFLWLAAMRRKRDSRKPAAAHLPEERFHVQLLLPTSDSCCSSCCHGCCWCFMAATTQLLLFVYQSNNDPNTGQHWPELLLLLLLMPLCEPRVGLSDGFTESAVENWSAVC
jgi:hypothetical protein